MLGLFKGNARKKLQKAYEDKLAKALTCSRNGDLRTHSTLMQEAEEIYARIQEEDRKLREN